MGDMMAIEEAPSDVEEVPGGGAIVKIGPDQPEQEKIRAFYANLVDEIPEATLLKLASDLLECIDRDKKSREKRDKQYEEAIKRTGLGREAPGGADFEGASKAVHPLLTEACVDFASRAIVELMPPNGPVKSFVPGDRPTAERLEKAERKKNYMNWQFLVQMPDFRTELEQLLTQLPLGGSQYIRLVYDAQRGRPVPIFVPIDDVYLPYAASNFYTAERVTYAEHITRFEFEQRVASGMYRDIGELITPQSPDETNSEKATDRIEGKSKDYGYNEDGLRTVFEVAVNWELDEQEGSCPYLITIDQSSRKVISVVRNWEEEDEAKEPLYWIVEFPFVPWRGAYSIGLGQMIGSLAGGATGALRALLDSAHMNNLPTLLKLKGANFSGQSQELNVAEVTEIEGGVVGDNDIRKLIMAVPFNPPSPVLFQLLGFLVDAGKGVVRTTFDKLSDQSANMPVGTTLALIEEGMKVIGGIHLRLYHAMDKIFRVLHRIDRMYLDDEEIKDEVGDLIAYRKDFELPLDVVPMANPEVFSDVQRMAQLQVVADRAAAAPDLYDRRRVEKRILEHTKIPNAEELLVPQEKPEEQNAVNENAAMTLGRPVAAFPEQDHLAHLQVHLDYMKSPLLGGLPIIAPTYLPMVLEHIKEHLTLWYVSETFDKLKASLNADDAGIKQMLSFHDTETRAELDRMLATVTKESVIPLVDERFAQIPEIIGQAMQMLQSLQPQPEIPQDPNQMAEIEARREIEGRKEETAQLRLAHDKEMKFMELSAEEQQQALKSARDEALKAQERAARLEELMMKEEGDTQRSAAEMASREMMNMQDNETALTIANAEIDAKEKVSVSTGTGINPNP